MTAPILKLHRLRGCRQPWRVTLGGSDREFSVGTRALLCAESFRRCALLATGLLMPLLSEQEWLRIVGAAMSRVEVVESGDAS
jgi:hypothetical protein